MINRDIEKSGVFICSKCGSSNIEILDSPERDNFIQNLLHSIYRRIRQNRGHLQGCIHIRCRNCSHEATIMID